MSLQASKPIDPSIPKPNGQVTDAHRKVGQLTRKAIRETVQEAVALKRLAFETAMALRETSGSAEAVDGYRAHAQAVAAAIKSWDMACDRIRIERGKPLPGSLRPEAKPKRQKQASWAMIDLVPVKQLPSPKPDSE